MQPATDNLKIGYHDYTLLLTCFLIAINSSEVRTAS